MAGNKAISRGGSPASAASSQDSSRVVNNQANSEVKASSPASSRVKVSAAKVSNLDNSPGKVNKAATNRMASSRAAITA